MNQKQETALRESSWAEGAVCPPVGGRHVSEEEAPGLLLYGDWWDAIRLLSPVQKAAILEGMFSLLRQDVPPPRFSKQGEACFAFIRNRVLRDAERFRSVRKARRAAGRAGGAKRAETLAKEREHKWAAAEYEAAFRRAVEEGQRRQGDESCERGKRECGEP